MKIKLFCVRNRHSAVGVLTALLTRQATNRDSIPAMDKRFVSTCLRSIQPSMQCVPRALSLGYGGRGVKLPIHRHLVATLRLGGTTGPLYHTTPRRAKGQVYYFTSYIWGLFGTLRVRIYCFSIFYLNV